MMKKVILLAGILMMALLAGCGAKSDYKVAFTKQLYFLKDHAAPFEIKVLEKGKAAKGLHISAEFSMVNMDHGTEKIKLTEGQKGKYSGKVALPMDGKYEITFTLERGGQKEEKTIQYTVKKAEGVASINGQWIKEEDLQFYKLVNQLQLAVNRENAQKTYSGAELNEQLSYLDSQEKDTNDQNQLLTQIIRIRAMALLSEQKGHQATETAIQDAIARDHNQYNQYPSAQKLISAFGEDRFHALEMNEYKYIVLSKQVEADVRQQTIKDNPNVNQQEINFQTQQNYEDLLVSQMNSVKVIIL
jgi:hypothetical protein